MCVRVLVSCIFVDEGLIVHQRNDNHENTNGKHTNYTNGRSSRALIPKPGDKLLDAVFDLSLRIVAE